MYTLWSMEVVFAARQDTGMEHTEEAYLKAWNALPAESRAKAAVRSTGVGELRDGVASFYGDMNLPRWDPMRGEQARSGDTATSQGEKK